MIEISEERKNEECYCEDPNCRYFPLKHFETCPNCESKSYHLTKSPFTMVQEE